VFRSHTGTLAGEQSDDFQEFSELDEALARNPDLAIICNPTSLHIPVALAAAKAGCHLFIEKPLSHSLEWCDKLLELVQQRQLTTMVGCQFRFHPLLLKLRDEIRIGRIGEVVGARAEWGEYLPKWHPWEDHRNSYSARTNLGGGAILTLIHPLDYLRWIFGGVKNVHSSMRSVPSLQTETSDDLAEVTLEFESGVIGQVHLDYIQSPAVHVLTVLGDEGRAELQFNTGALTWHGKDGSRVVDTAPDGFERNVMFVDEMRHFVGCVEQHKTTCVTLEDGIESLKLALRAKGEAVNKN